jgi:opacity protein-like surface antigen
LTAIWDATGKTRVTSEVWRDISSLGDEIATYAIVNGISIEPQWAITPKTLLKAFAGYEQRDFSGSRELPDGGLGNLPLDSDRVDDVYTYIVGAEWKIRDNVILSFEYNAGNRNSTRELQDYDYQAIQGQLRVGL